MNRYFGTDGIRGIANAELTCKMAFELGRIVVRALGKRIVVGKDTRRSGDLLEAALSAGIMSAGGTALKAGIVPTPAVALLTRELDAGGAVVISASHNPPAYNGLKLFDGQGFKLTATLERDIDTDLYAALEGATETRSLTPTLAIAGERSVVDTVAGSPSTTGRFAALPPTGGDVGTTVELKGAVSRYIAQAVATVAEQGIDLTGLRVAVDCGHGAAYQTTPAALRELGAEVEAINTNYDGMDINVASGSTHLEPLRELVLASKADIGIAHDGDADRVLAVDAQGNEVDGDYILALCAIDLHERGLLANNTVVGTVMANLGFAHAMRERGIAVVSTSVGDSNVLAAMQEGGFVLGGEQSGHIIFSQHNSTGDGLITALQLLALVKRREQPLHELARAMHKYPQKLINVRVADKSALGHNAAIATAIDAAEVELNGAGGGRVLVRASGTEPLVRVMVEAATDDLATQYANTLAHLVEAEL